MKYAKRPLSILLSVVLILSMFTIIPATTASAESVQIFARKWVEAENVTGDYFSFTDLYSNFIICRVDPEGGFDDTDFNTDQNAVWNRTGDLTLTGNNKFVINTWNDGNGHSLGGYWDTDPGRQNDGNIYLSTEGFNSGADWYAYTWETFTADSVDEVYPTYDESAQYPYQHGTMAHYVSGDRKFVAVEGTTDGHQNVQQAVDAELVVPYFRFEQFGTMQDPLIKLVKCNSHDANIIVPETIPANYPNEAWNSGTVSFNVIAGGAFKDNTTLETVRIGDNVNHIGADQISQGSPIEMLGAFEGCTNLREVYIGRTDASAFNRADLDCFEGCTSLELIESTSKRNDKSNDSYEGIYEIASDIEDATGEPLEIHCYHDSSLAYWFVNNNDVDLEFLETTEPIHTFIENSDCIKWTWNDDGGNVSAKVALKCTVCELRTEVNATLEPVADSHPASCTDPVEGHYKAVAQFDGQTFNNHGYQYKCTIPGKAHTPMTEGEYANRYKLDTSSGVVYEMKQQFKCSVCNTVYEGAPFEVTFHPSSSNTCTADGNYDYCTDQDNNYYRSIENTNDLYEKVDSYADVIIPAAHTLVNHPYVAPGCTTTGKQEYWECTVCGKYFSDADGKTEITNVSIDPAGHTLVHYAYEDATSAEEGHLEHWKCSVCGKCFSDADGSHEIKQEYTVIPVYDIDDVDYIGKTGGVDSVLHAHKIKSSSTYINGAAGTYVVAPNETVTIDEFCEWTGDIDLILCDGAVLNITKGLKVSNGSLTIYGQSGQTGTLNVSGDGEKKAMEVSGGLDIYGGVINASNSFIYSIHVLGAIRIERGAVTTDKTIASYSNVGIYGGQIRVNDNIFGAAGITLYPTETTDSIYAKHYSTRYSNPGDTNTVIIRSRVFNGTKFIEADTEYTPDNFDDIDGKTLLVRQEHEHTPLTHREERLATEGMDGYKEHWYCSACQKYFTDPYGAIEVPESEIILRSGDGIPFLDKDGDVFKVYYAYNATKITESSDYLGAPGFYYVDGNVTINEHCRWNEDVKLILCDGATLTVNYTPDDYDKIGVDIYGALTIYGQTAGTGKFNINVIDPNHDYGRTWALDAYGITVNGGNLNISVEGKDGCLGINTDTNHTVIINGGNVAITVDCDTYDDGENSRAYAIRSYDVTMYGGSLNVESKDDLYAMFVSTKFSFYGGKFTTDNKCVAEGGVIMSWKNASDSFHSEEGFKMNNGAESRLLMPFVDESNNYYEGVIDADSIKGKTLTPYTPHEHDLTRHPATAPTAMLPGNTEYWECPTCVKYYSDEHALHEIALADTVIAPLNTIKDNNVYAVGDTVIIPSGTKLYYFNGSHNQGAIKTFSSDVNLVVNQSENDSKEYLTAEDMGNYLANISRSTEGYVFTGYFATIEEVVNYNGSFVETFAVEPIYAKESSVSDDNWTWGTGENDLPTASVTLTDFYWLDFGGPTKIELSQTINAAITSVITDAATCQHEGTKQYTAVAEAYDGRFTAIQERTYTGTHYLAHNEYIAATCNAVGIREHWVCRTCNKMFYDANAEQEIVTEEEIHNLVIPIDPTAHNLTAHPAKAATLSEDGNTAYWSCSICGKYFSDEACEHEIDENSWVIRKTAVAHVAAGDDELYTADFKEAVIFAVSHQGAVIEQLQNATCEFSENDAATYTTFKVKKDFHDLVINIPDNSYTLTTSEDFEDFEVVTTYTITENPYVMYLAEDHTDHKAYNAIAITADTTDLSESRGWYYVEGDVTISGDLNVTANVNIILTNGATLTINGENGVKSNYDINFYRQSGETEGKLIADKLTAHELTLIGGDLYLCKTVALTDDLEMTGGKLTVYTQYDFTNTALSAHSVYISGGEADLQGSCGIYAVGSAESAVNISGGRVIAHGKNNAINSYHVNITGGDVTAVIESEVEQVDSIKAIIGLSDITLSWTNPSDSIYVKSYSRDVTLLKTFKDYNDNLYKAGTVKNSKIADKTLYPAIPHEHSPLTHVAEVPATCTVDGTLEHWKCDECGKLFSDEEGYVEVSENDLIDEADGHDWDYENGTWNWTGTADSPEVTFTYSCVDCDATETVNNNDEVLMTGFTVTEDVEPTCTEAGHKTYKATFCYIYTSEHTYEVPALGHGNLVHVAATNPACNNGSYTNGNIEYWRCERCGKLYSDQTLEHEVTQAQTVLPYFVFEYNELDEQYGVYGYNGADTVVTIPDTVPDNYPDESLRGKDVEYLHFTAFGNNGEEDTSNKNITKVIMGDTMKNLGWRAFAGCSNLTEVEIGNSLYQLGDGLFFGCPEFRTLTCTTTEGYITFFQLFDPYASVTFRGCHEGAFRTISNNIFLASITYIGIDEHDGICKFNWDGYECETADLTCSECDLNETLVATVHIIETAPTAYSNGTKEYRAIAVYGDQTYTSSKFVTIPALGVSYIDENGETQTVYDITPITAGTTTLTGGWYAADGNVTINGSVNITGDVKIILTNTATLTVNGEFGHDDPTPGSTFPITIYRQSGIHVGKLIANSIAASDFTMVGGCVEAIEYVAAYGNATINGDTLIIGYKYMSVPGNSAHNAFYCGGNFTVHGGYTDMHGKGCIMTPGTVTVDGGELFNEGYEYAIQADKVVINGGKVDAEALAQNSVGIRSLSDITLNLTDPDKDGVLASSYSAPGGVIIVNPLTDEDNNIYMPATVTNTSPLSGKYLAPAPKHEHELTRVAASDGDCQTKGNIEYWYCRTCDKYFTDSYGITETTQEQTLTDYGAHNGVHQDLVRPTYNPETGAYTNGAAEHYVCSVCGKYFSDENCHNEITQADTVLPYFSFSDENNEVLLTGYFGTDAEIVIPDTVPDNYPDTSLRDRAVITIKAYTFENNTTITKLTAGNNLMYIGYRAFYGCTNLEEVHIGSGIRCFYAESFFGCNAITDFWCTKTDNIVGNGSTTTLFTHYTFNRQGGFTFHGPHTGAFHYEAFDMAEFNYPSTVDFTYIGTDAHTYDVDFTWWDDGTVGANATASCSKCHILPVQLDDVTITSAITKDPGDRDGVITYTASVEYNGVTYTDTKTETIPCCFPKHSLTLSGDIGVNFYVRADSADVAAGKAKVNFAWNGKTETVTLGGDPVTVDGMQLYKATLNVSASEMNDPITAALYIGDEQKAVHHYTVRDYCDVILSPEYAASFSETSYTYSELSTLVKTMLNYGAMSQKQFSHNTGNLANHDIGYDLTPLGQGAIYSLANDLPKSSDFDEKLAPYGVKYYGCSLLLRSKTTMRFYFEKTGTGTFSADNFTINGEKAEVKNYKDGSRYVYIEVADIPSPDLGIAYDISVDSGEDFVFIGYISPLSYVKDVLLDATASEDLKNVVTALTRYYQAAHELFH